MKKKFILLLVLLTVIAYSPSLTNGFVVDDELLILHNPIIKSVQLFPLIFKTALCEYSDTGRSQALYDRMYRPMQTLSYWFEYRVWSINPFGYHLTNIILHALNGILVFILLSLIFDAPIAQASALLFMVSPMQASVVSYVSARADLLVSTFMLLSMICFLKSIQSRKTILYIISILAGFIALFCRENALTLPLFIALILYLNKSRAAFYLRVIPYILGVFFYAALRWYLFGFYGLTMHPPFLNFWLRLLNFLNITIKYIILLVFPVNLRMIRVEPFVKSVFDLRLIYVCLFLIAGIFLFVKFRKNRKAVFASLFFMTGLIPVFFCFDGYLFYGQAMMAESWVYLASLGFFALFSLLSMKYFGRYFKIVLVLLLLIYTGLSIINNRNWKNDCALYPNSLKFLAEQNPLHATLAKKYIESSKYNQAAYELKLYAKYFPESSLRYVLQGDFFYAVGDFKKAVENYNLAIKINKRSFQAYSGLSRSYKAQGKFEPALASALESVKLNPYSVEGLVWLGDLYLENNDFKPALKYFESAQEIDPSSKIVTERLQRCKTNQ